VRTGGEEGVGPGESSARGQAPCGVWREGGESERRGAEVSAALAQVLSCMEVWSGKKEEGAWAGLERKKMGQAQEDGIFFYLIEFQNGLN
jgi:hypothetical protein